MFHTHLPTTTDLYNGVLYHVPANEKTLKLVVALRKRIQAVLGMDYIELAHMAYLGDVYTPLKTLREEIALNYKYQAELVEIVKSLNWRPEDFLLDKLQLRSIIPDGYNTAPAAYSGHRDTWFGYPQELINIWIPLFDVSKEQTFEFYPELFKKEIKNDSKYFNNSAWKAKASNTTYSSAPPPIDTIRAGFSASAGDLIIFSGHHYHKTKEVPTNKIRYSIDFRLLNKQDTLENKGPKNYDNESKLTAQNYFKDLAN